ncbi:MAG: DUF4205 domain-containing protein [Methanosarcinales archaeon]|nr:MAG: DUF4205 domain-containing protein [Methanosarcinales archaeon]
MAWYVLGARERVAESEGSVRMRTPHACGHSFQGVPAPRNCVCAHAACLCTMHCFLQFSHPGSPAAVLLLYSAMLTRGIDGVRADMDADLTGHSARLIDQQYYGTQELLNLCLTGRATSNPFDGERTLTDASRAGGEGVTLRGVFHQPLCGFLSAFEATGAMLVGDYYKRPQTPIWVVFAQSHYFVLFAAPKGVLVSDAALAAYQAAKAPGRRTAAAAAASVTWLETATRGLSVASSAPTGTPAFDMFYVNGLASLESFIRFTVTPRRSDADGVDTEESDNDDVNVLNSVVRTRWTGATMRWYSAEARVCL